MWSQTASDIDQWAKMLEPDHLCVTQKTAATMSALSFFHAVVSTDCQKRWSKEEFGSPERDDIFFQNFVPATRILNPRLLPLLILRPAWAPLAKIYFIAFGPLDQNGESAPGGRSGTEVGANRASRRGGGCHGFRWEFGTLRDGLPVFRPGHSIHPGSVSGNYSGTERLATSVSK